MKPAGKTWVSGLIVMCAITLMGRAATRDSANPGSDDPTGEQPYSAIWLRNVFDLKPPKPVEVEAPKTNAPPPNVKLTGITTIFGKKQALFTVQDQPLPGQPQKKEMYLMLTENQRQDSLEVLEINPKAGTVKIKNEDIVSTITFETNKVASGGPGPAPVMGGAPTHPGGFTPPNAFPNRPLMRGGAAPPMGGYNSAGGSPSGYQPNGTPASAAAGYSPYGYSGGGGTAGLSLNGNSGSTAAAGSAPSLSADEQIALLRQQQAAMTANLPSHLVPPALPGIGGTSENGSGANPSQNLPPVPTSSVPSLPTYLQPTATGTYK